MMSKIQFKDTYLFKIVSFLLVLVNLILFKINTTSALAPLQSSFRVVGNQIIYGNNQVYVPEGISVYGGLEAKNYNVNSANVDAQVEAASKYWHANTIRFQVAESNLFKNKKNIIKINQNFLKTLTNQVNLAHSLGLIVVINDQTEFTNLTVAPTSETSRFWSIIADKFKNDPYVIFDLFNEPRFRPFILKNNYKSSPKLNTIFRNYKFVKPTQIIPISQNKIWQLWKFGGSFNGIKYVGMQTLVNQIRAKNVANLIWTEGPNQARELPAGKFLLTGSNIVYSIHHPNLNNKKSWAIIGDLSNIRPVVDGEWAQYQSPWAECFSDAYTNTPIYLNYLKSHNVGIIAWSLQPGSLVKGDSNTIPSNLNNKFSPQNPSLMKNPSILFPSYDCGNEFGQGVGQLLQNYFAQNSNLISL